MSQDEQLRVLNYAARPTVIGKYLGQLALVLAVITCAPLLVSLYFSEYELGWRYTVVALGLVLAGAPLSRLRADESIQTNEALAITALAFILVPLVMSYPMMAAGMPFIDALFEAVSGVTTTGLSTLDTLTGKPAAFLFSRAWMQWYGGLGIVVLSVALLLGHHATLRRLLEPELSGESLASTTRIHARRVLAVYVALTVGGVSAVWILCGDFFSALTYTLAAVSTGGFSPNDTGLASLASWPARLMIITLGLLGAISLSLYYYAIRQRRMAVLRDVELRALLLIVALVVAVLFGSLGTHQGWSLETFYHALTLGVSAQSTTGFATLDLAGLDPATKLITLMSMLIGGSVGSTAGGIKVLRLLIVLRLLQLMIRRLNLPTHAVVTPQLGRKPLANDDILRALSLIALFAMVVFLSWLPFVASGYDPLDALFEVVSASATVGLSTGITSENLPAFLKGVLMMDMIMGRVEIVALLLVLYPRTWLGKRSV